MRCPPDLVLMGQAEKNAPEGAFFVETRGAYLPAITRTISRHLFE